jgi:hypothetical protein
VYLISDKKYSDRLLAKLRQRWNAPIYTFFGTAQVKYDGDRKYHYFPCGAKHCKGPKNGVRRYLDTSDKSSTTNLKSHAIKCWGRDAINSATTAAKEGGRDTSIHAAFARQGQRPVTHTHRSHTNPEIRYVLPSPSPHMSLT